MSFRVEKSEPIPPETATVAQAAFPKEITVMSLRDELGAVLVYFEFHGDMASAITREKQLKKWNRSWKVRLIKEKNPDLKDLCGGLL